MAVTENPSRGVGLDGDVPTAFPLSRVEMGMWILVGVVAMLFAGLSSAYIVVRGAPGWQNIALPPVLWVNTALLVISSVTLELAKRAVRRNRQSAVRLWIAASALLGAAFIVGQLAAWQQLMAAGVYLPTTHHSSFFYVLTALHGIHLIGGIVGFGIAWRAAFQGRLTLTAHEPLKVCALYWHAMDAIWIYLFLLLILA